MLLAVSVIAEAADRFSRLRHTIFFFGTGGSAKACGSLGTWRETIS
jgi:hypothetical protein